MKTQKIIPKKIKKDLKKILKSLDSFSSDASDILSVQGIRNRQIVMENEIYDILDKYNIELE